jgi:SOS-response transcriptional repressor LexA
MATRDNREFLRRLKEGLKEAGISARRASIEAGFGPDLIRDYERKPKTMPTIDAVQALAEVINKPPEYLAFNRRRPRQRAGSATMPRTVQVIGEVAAGLWLELASMEQREFEQYSIPFDPSYPQDAQFGLRVVGTSINKKAEDGEILHCVDRAIAGIEPNENDLVIVERRRAQGGVKEVTAKLYRRRGKVIELSPSSTDRRWTEPIVFDPTKAAGDEEVVITAVVIAIYKPLRRRVL